MSFEFDQFDPNNTCAGCRWQMWHLENSKISEAIDFIAEYGGSTLGMKERLQLLEDNQQPEYEPTHTCGSWEAPR